MISEKENVPLFATKKKLAVEWKLIVKTNVSWVFSSVLF